MKQIYYVIQALIHGRGANIIKVVSLGTFIKYYKISQLIHTQSIAN